MLNRSARLPRAGFTLIEMMVVIAIVAVLAALAAGAYIKVMGSQQAANTENGMRMIDKYLREQWIKVKTDADKEFDSLDPATQLQAVYALANNDTERARVLWRIFRLTEAFPQSYVEINNAVNSDPKVSNSTIYGFSYQGPPRPTTTYWYWIPQDRRSNLQTFSRRISTPSAGFNKPATQSAACLFLTLTQMGRGGNLRLTEDLLPANVADTDGDGVKEFVDGFSPRKPLTFIRFPIWTNPTKPRINFVSAMTPKIDLAITTELNAFNPNAANPKFGDPLDPTGLLQQTINGVPWYLTQYTPPALPAADASLFTPKMTNGDLLAQLCAHPFPHKLEYNGQPYTYISPQPFYMPIIISNGADGTYDTTDDIVSFRLKVGARGD